MINEIDTEQNQKKSRDELTAENLATAILRHSPIGGMPEAKLIAFVIVRAADDCVDSRKPEEAYLFAVDGRINVLSESIGVPAEYVRAVFWAYILHKLEIKTKAAFSEIRDAESGLTINELKKKNRELKKENRDIKNQLACASI